MKEVPAPMPREILVGDKIRLNPKRSATYVRFYGKDATERVWQVVHVYKEGRKRLIVDDTPTMIYAGDAVLAYPGQSKFRRDHLTKLGVKLP